MCSTNPTAGVASRSQGKRKILFAKRAAKSNSSLIGRGKIKKNRSSNAVRKKERTLDIRDSPAIGLHRSRGGATFKVLDKDWKDKVAKN